MTGLTRYYLRRAGVAIAFGLAVALAGSAWWIAIVLAAVVFVFFLWAPRSGRYAVNADLGVTALRRDERGQVINDKSARNAFVVTMLAVAAIAVYFGSIARTAVPVALVEAILLLGAATYFLSDFWLRRD